MRDDFDEARRRMRVPDSIPPIRDNFAQSGGMAQGAQGFNTMAAFFRSWMQVRRERRQNRHD